MIAAFSAADQLRRRPAPVNTSIRRTGSGICLCSEIDMCRSPHPLRQSPFRRQTERWRPDTAYYEGGRIVFALRSGEAERLALLRPSERQGGTGDEFLRGEATGLPAFQDRPG